MVILNPVCSYALNVDVVVKVDLRTAAEASKTMGSCYEVATVVEELIGRLITFQHNAIG